MKFGDRSHQKTERQQGKAWNLPKTYRISKKRTKLHPSRPRTEASATTATGQTFAQPQLRRVLVAVPPAGGYGAMSRTALWSFGGQGRKSANVGVHTETRTMEISQVCAPLLEKRTCQPKLVRARSIGPGRLRALQHPPALGFASWPGVTDTASTASSSVIDLFTASTDLP